MMVLNSFAKMAVSAVAMIVLGTASVSAQEAANDIVGGLEEFPLQVFQQGADQLTLESAESNGSQFVLYQLKTESGNVHCSGVSLSAKQFLTSQHCTKAVESLADITLVGDNAEAKVEHVDEIPGMDAAVVTMDRDSFHSPCARISDEQADQGEELDLYTVDLATGGVQEEQLRVEQLDYAGRNPDLGIISYDLIRATALDGSPTRPGDSGSPVFRKNEHGDYLLAGIVVGVSEKSRDVIVQPVSSIAARILERCDCCEAVKYEDDCRRPTSTFR